MKWKGFTYVALTVALLLTVGSHATIAQNAPRQVAIVSRGTVEVERNSIRITLKVGAPLYAEDIVTVKSDSQASIRCSSNQAEFPLPNDNIPRPVTNFCS